MAPRSAAGPYFSHALQRALALPAGRKALLRFLLAALFAGVLAYALIATLLLQFDLRLEGLFAIGIVIGLLVWALIALANLLSAAIMRQSSLHPAQPLPVARNGQVLRYVLAAPWLNMSEDEGSEALKERGLPAQQAQKWQYGGHLLLPLIAKRSQSLEEAQNAVSTLQQSAPLRWDPRQLPLHSLTNTLTGLGIVLAAGIGSLSAWLFCFKLGNSKLILLQASALGLGLGLLVALLFLLPAALAKGVYLSEVFELETSPQNDPMPGLLGQYAPQAPSQPTPPQPLSPA